MRSYRKGDPWMNAWDVSASAIPRAILPAALSALLCAAIEVSPNAKDGLNGLLDDSYAFQVFAYIVVFALVFRTQAAYGRFVDGCVTVTAMSSRWGDAAMCLLTFDTQAWEGPDGSAAEARASAVRAQALLVHRFSLLHAVALQALRRDSSLLSLEAALPSASTLHPPAGDNTGGGDPLVPPGVVGVEMSPGGAERQASVLLSQRQGGRGGPRGCRGADPIACASSLPVESVRATRAGGGPTPNSPAHLPLPAAVESPAGRPCPECGRVWCSCSGEAPPPLAGRLGRSRMSASAKLRSSNAWRKLPVLGGVSNGELALLLSVGDRAALVHAQLVEGLVSRRAAGGLGVDSPVLAVAFSNLAAGAEGFRQARRLEDIPFPFPYGQMLSFMLVCFGCLYPVVVSMWVGDAQRFPWAAPVLTFITMLLLVGLYKVARELEDPFAHPPNDLPSLLMQAAFNDRLIDAWRMVTTARDTPGEQAEEAAAIDAIMRRHAPSLVARMDRTRAANAPSAPFLQEANGDVAPPEPAAASPLVPQAARTPPAPGSRSPDPPYAALSAAHPRRGPPHPLYLSSQHLAQTPGMPPAPGMPAAACEAGYPSSAVRGGSPANGDSPGGTSGRFPNHGWGSPAAGAHL